MKYAVEHEGRWLTLKQLAQTVGVPYPTMIRRWRQGDRGERLKRPSDPKFSRTGRW